MRGLSQFRACDTVGTKQGLALPSDPSKTTIATSNSTSTSIITACVVVAAAVDKRTNQVAIRMTTLYEQRSPKSSVFFAASIDTRRRYKSRLAFPKWKNKARRSSLPTIQVVPGK
jgi:hypothetical protein